uniref:Retrovirus-related Pol polyprotein from transposon TNT 1-94 n=1 Tax=Tanacetum cinerariifolium TaxID=118510 RepID=A0A699IYY6_TANCI|nr:retrovirus-related Pol polyprotein from transposon TNT 1-94 [Tanacetum cinerariifolium]
MKGIKREFIVARTPQQNCVAEKKNKTSIEAARNMLVDSKLPTTFWVEVVNTACYVLNRALVIKSHNKTPYELIRRRTPLIDFMKPFGCLVTILNTRDYLGKFDGKANEGFFSWALCGEAKKKKEPEQEYILIPFCTTDPLISQGPKDNEIDAGKKDTEERQTKHLNNTNSFNTISTPVSAAGPSFADAAPSSPVNAARTPISTTNAFEEHIFKQFSPFKNAFIFHMFQMCLQCMILEFLVMLMMMKMWNKRDKWVIGTKWVFQNKKDERGIVVNNKSRLVAQGHTQEEGIDYDKFFAPVARIEAIRLFLAYASFKDFVVYQMDVKSDFIYGKIEKKVYVYQPFGFEDPDFPDKVYKVENALYRLHHAPRACQDKHVADILKKFDFSTVKTVSTRIEPNKSLIKDEDSKDVDVHLYRSMIGSLIQKVPSVTKDFTSSCCE